MACIDGLLWLGESNHRYRWFDCGGPTCAIPITPYRGKDHCFVHEAERRGVSRKISHLPAWVEPGRTKIFVAHHAGLGTPYRGKIFGYFTVERIDLIGEAPDNHTGAVRAAGEAPAGRSETDSVEPDISRRPQRTRQPPSDPISELIEYITKYWIQEWIEARPEMRSTTITRLCDEQDSEHRSCSKRINVGSVYLVDALCAQIDDAWAELRRATPGAGTDVFNELVEQILQLRHRVAIVPPDLDGEATIRGELVLFDDPPFFEAHPRASFRSIAHIDGDHLLDQIVRGVRTPGVRHCVAPAQGALSKDQIAAFLVERCHLTMKAAREVQTEIASLARGEINRAGEFRLPHVGTIRERQPLTDPLTESAVTAAVAEKTGLTNGRCGDVLAELSDLVATELLRIGRFRVSGLGTLEMRSGCLVFEPHKPLVDRGPSLEPYKGFVCAIKG